MGKASKNIQTTNSSAKASTLGLTPITQAAQQQSKPTDLEFPSLLLSLQESHKCKSEVINDCRNCLNLKEEICKL